MDTMCVWLSYCLLLSLMCSMDSTTGIRMVTSNMTEEEARAAGITEEQRLLAALRRNYDASIRPVFDANQPVVIKLGITLTQIIDVDEKNQVLTTNVWLDQDWTDEKLIWNPTDFNNITIIRIPCDLIWLPDIVLYNSVDNHNKGYMRSLVMLKNDGGVFWPPIVRMRSSCKMDITFFPFDDQLCHLKMGSWAYDGFQVDVTNRSLDIDLTNYVDNGEWELIGTKVIRRVKTYTCCPEPFMDVTFYLLIRRRVLYYFLNVIIPCMLLSSLSLTGFLLPPDSGEKVTLGLTVLLAFSVFMLLVAENMPPTSEYIPLIGIYLTVIMAMSALSVALSVFVLNCHHRGTMMHRPSRLIRETCVTVAKVFCVRLLYLKQSNNNATMPSANKSPMKRVDYSHFQPTGGNPSFGTSDSSPMLCSTSTNRQHPNLGPAQHCCSSINTATSSPQSNASSCEPRPSHPVENNIACNGSTAPAQAPRTRTRDFQRSKDSNRTVLESQILHYLKAVLEAYDNSFEDRVAILEWQEVARVLDKFFFWLFVAITALSTIFLLLLSPITKHVEFPEE